jgi:NitT/TauT family transport system ATP-binding protein
MKNGKVPVISMNGVCLSYRGSSGNAIEALQDISFDVPAHSVVSVVGPSGCGKTTLLKLVSRVFSPTKGQLQLEGVPIQRANLAGRLSYVFQKPLLLPWRSALANVLMPLEIVAGKIGPQEIQRARDALHLTGLKGFEESYPSQLSGGMQQRVSLARALVIEPEVLLMDEPFSALDEITRETLQSELLRIWQSAKSAALFITHNVDEAVLLSDKVIILSSRPGRIIRQIEIDLARPRDIEVRRSSRYRDLVDEVRTSLRHDEQAAAR